MIQSTAVDSPGEHMAYERESTSNRNSVALLAAERLVRDVVSDSAPVEPPSPSASGAAPLVVAASPTVRPSRPASIVSPPAFSPSNRASIHSLPPPRIIALDEPPSIVAETSLDDPIASAAASRERPRPPPRKIFHLSEPSSSPLPPRAVFGVKRAVPQPQPRPRPTPTITVVTANRRQSLTPLSPQPAVLTEECTFLGNCMCPNCR